MTESNLMACCLNQVHGSTSYAFGLLGNMALKGSKRTTRTPRWRQQHLLCRLQKGMRKNFESLKRSWPTQ
jgi:hypothetical protein